MSKNESVYNITQQKNQKKKKRKKVKGVDSRRTGNLN